MSERERRRRGTGTSIAGDAADEVIRALVDQFSDRYAFIRELIQNSLDAGASRIAVRMAYAHGVLEIEVADDGEGMDRATIEGYLLVKFRSTKDKDLTKIGKFGIGFVSLFAMRPFEVIVDTGRDALWHQVRFAEDMSWTLVEKSEPREGTTVCLRIRQESSEASETCLRIDASAVRWCRYAEAGITTEAKGIRDFWGERSIRADFTIEAPVVVREEGDGFVALLAPHPALRPPVGFYNRGLTLWEADEALLPGVTFRVAGRHLEHTLTRDNVRRDRHFDEVLSRLRALAAERLGAAIHDAARAAAGDLGRLRELFAAIGPEVPWKWDVDAPLLPAIGRDPMPLAELRAGLLGRVFGRAPPLYVSPTATGLATQVAASEVVLLGAPNDPHVAFAAGYAGREAVLVDEAFVCATRVAGAGHADLATAIAMLWAIRGDGRQVHCGRFAGGGWLMRQRVAFEPEPADAGDGLVVVIAADHPLTKRLLALPPAVAAPLALRAIDRKLGGGGPVGDDLVLPLLDALELR